jgi:Fe2+ transport system protein FeoA
VVLAPNKSIKKNSQGQTVVNVIVGQKVEERPVVLGLTDGKQTEVINGLNAGDTVIRYAKDTNAKLG